MDAKKQLVTKDADSAERIAEVAEKLGAARAAKRGGMSAKMADACLESEWKNVLSKNQRSNVMKNLGRPPQGGKHA